jgi:Ras-related protein Rab-5C
MLQAAGQTGREIKVVMLGSTTVGKSSIVTRYTRDMFDPDAVSTVGAAFMTKTIVLGTQSLKLQIWDTGGSERYRAMAPNYYHSADAAIIIYDITSIQSYQEVASWIYELREQASNIVAIALVGNKIDRSDARAVETETGRAFAKSNNLQVFIETSALTGENVADAFAQIASAVMKAQGVGKSHRMDTQLRAGGKKDDPTRKTCCA